MYHKSIQRNKNYRNNISLFYYYYSSSSFCCSCCWCCCLQGGLLYRYIYKMNKKTKSKNKKIKRENILNRSWKSYVSYMKICNHVGFAYNSLNPESDLYLIGSTLFFLFSYVSMWFNKRVFFCLDQNILYAKICEYFLFFFFSGSFFLFGLSVYFNIFCCCCLYAYNN